MSTHRITITEIPGHSLDRFTAGIIRALPHGAKVEHALTADEEPDEAPPPSSKPAPEVRRKR